MNGIAGEHFNKFGIIDEKVLQDESKSGPKIVVRQDEIKKIKIRSENIKNLSKTTNLSTSSNIRFFFEDDMAIRLSCNIGCYGRLVIHMLDADTAGSN